MVTLENDSFLSTSTTVDGRGGGGSVSVYIQEQFHLAGMIVGGNQNDASDSYRARTIDKLLSSLEGFLLVDGKEVVWMVDGGSTAKKTFSCSEAPLFTDFIIFPEHSYALGVAILLTSRHLRLNMMDGEVYDIPLSMPAKRFFQGLHGLIVEISSYFETDIFSDVSSQNNLNKPELFSPEHHRSLQSVSPDFVTSRQASYFSPGTFSYGASPGDKSLVDSEDVIKTEEQESTLKHGANSFASSLFLLASPINRMVPILRPKEEWEERTFSQSKILCFSSRLVLSVRKVPNHHEDTYEFQLSVVKYASKNDSGNKSGNGDESHRTSVERRRIPITTPYSGLVASHSKSIRQSSLEIDRYRQRQKFGSGGSPHNSSGRQSPSLGLTRSLVNPMSQNVIGSRNSSPVHWETSHQAVIVQALSGTTGNKSGRIGVSPSGFSREGVGDDRNGHFLGSQQAEHISQDKLSLDIQIDLDNRSCNGEELHESISGLFSDCTLSIVATAIVPSALNGSIRHILYEEEHSTAKTTEPVLNAVFAVDLRGSPILLLTSFVDRCRATFNLAGANPLSSPNLQAFDELNSSEGLHRLFPFIPCRLTLGPALDDIDGIKTKCQLSLSCFLELRGNLILIRLDPRTKNWLSFRLPANAMDRDAVLTPIRGGSLRHVILSKTSGRSVLSLVQHVHHRSGECSNAPLLTKLIIDGLLCDASFPTAVLTTVTTLLVASAMCFSEDVSLLVLLGGSAGIQLDAILRLVGQEQSLRKEDFDHLQRMCTDLFSQCQHPTQSLTVTIFDSAHAAFENMILLSLAQQRSDHHLNQLIENIAASLLFITGCYRLFSEIQKTRISQYVEYYSRFLDQIRAASILSSLSVLTRDKGTLLPLFNRAFSNYDKPPSVSDWILRNLEYLSDKATKQNNNMSSDIIDELLHFNSPVLLAVYSERFICSESSPKSFIPLFMCHSFLHHLHKEIRGASCWKVMINNVKQEQHYADIIIGVKIILSFIESIIEIAREFFPELVEQPENKAYVLKQSVNGAEFLNWLPLPFQVLFMEAMKICSMCSEPILVLSSLHKRHEPKKSNDSGSTIPVLSLIPIDLLRRIGRLDVIASISCENHVSSTTRTGGDIFAKEKGANAFSFPGLDSKNKSDFTFADTSESVGNLVDDEDGLSWIESAAASRFPDDLRMKEVCRLLRSSRPLYLRVERSAEATDQSHRHKQQLKLLSLCRRSLACPVGRGALTMGSLEPLQAEKLPIPPVKLVGRLAPSNSLIALEMTSGQTELTLWPEFHNGVAAGLRILPESKGITRNWILYNRPMPASDAALNPHEENGHAGLLLGLGLHGLLKPLSLTDLCDYLTQGHDPTTVAILLGLSTTQLGTADATLSKTLCLHLPALLPPRHWEMDISPVVQAAAISGLGLLHCGTAHRLMTEFLLAEMVRRPNTVGDSTQTDMTLGSREALAISTGWALGMVLLGRGTSGADGGILDLKIEDRLHQYMVGGKRPLESQLFPLTHQRAGDANSKSSRILEGNIINTDVTAPGATIALAFMYMRSNNSAVIERLALPATSFEVDIIKPDLLLFRALSLCLVKWENVSPTQSWIISCTPATIILSLARARKGKLNKKLSDPHDDGEDKEGTNGISDASGKDELPTETIETNHDVNMSEPKLLDADSALKAYLCTTSGFCWGIGMVYAGTQNIDAKKTTLKFLRILQGLRDGKAKLRASLESDIEAGDGSPPYSTLFSAMEGKSTIPLLEMCISLVALSLSCIMAGTGDTVCFRILRELRWRAEETTYGGHMALSTSIGFLFLGGGKASFRRDPVSVGTLVIATCPRYASRTLDNQYHIQPLRHLYALAVEWRVLRAIDVDTKESVVTEVDLIANNGSKNIISVPCLLSDLDTIKRIQLSQGVDHFRSDAMEDRKLTPGTSWASPIPVISITDNSSLFSKVGNRGYLGLPLKVSNSFSSTFPGCSVVEEHRLHRRVLSPLFVKSRDSHFKFWENSQDVEAILKEMESTGWREFTLHRLFCALFSSCSPFSLVITDGSASATRRGLALIKLLYKTTK
jgi:hypothetical protein